MKRVPHATLTYMLPSYSTKHLANLTIARRPHTNTRNLGSEASSNPPTVHTILWSTRTDRDLHGGSERRDVLLVLGQGLLYSLELGIDVPFVH